MVTDILITVSIECLIHAYTFLLFLLALCLPVSRAVIRQILSLLHLFKILLSGKFEATLWVSSCIVLACGGDGCVQNQFQHVRNFWGLSAGTVDSPPWWDFPCPEGCQQFQRVLKLTLLTYTCSVCWGIQTFLAKLNRLQSYVYSQPIKYISLY